MSRKILLGLLCFLCISVAAEDRTAPFRYAIPGKWTLFQGGVFPYRLYSIYAPVYGVSLDAVIVIQEKVYGLSISPVGTYADDLYGASIGLFNSVKNQYGLLLGAVNLCQDNSGAMIGLVNGGRQIATPSRGGVQIGLYNVAESGMQIGLINHNANSPTPWMILFNYGSTEPRQAE